VIPHTTDPRADTGVTNVTLGIWLFLASEVMLFGSLFSAYALLRTSATAWPDGFHTLGVRLAFANTGVLVLASGLVWGARNGLSVHPVRLRLAFSTTLAVVFLVLKGVEYREHLAFGLTPSASTFLAAYFTLTGLHGLHVAGGAIANIWVVSGTSNMSADLTAGRVRALALYWLFVDVVWLVILTLFYLT
jgi:cytochrome c oxidase subunit 3